MSAYKGWQGSLRKIFCTQEAHTYKLHVLGFPYLEGWEKVKEAFKRVGIPESRHQAGGVHLLVDDVLCFGSGGGPSLMVLHQVNADKKANTPEGGEKGKLDTHSPKPYNNLTRSPHFR